MDFAAMKRRDLQALCKRHGLPAGGSNAGLVARLAAALPGNAGAKEVEEAVARKGCLKRSAGGEAKKVSFALEEEAEAKGRRRRSSVVFSPVVAAKTRGLRGKAAETLPAGSPAAEVSGRGRRQRRRAEVGGGSADEDGVAAVAGAGAPVRRSRRNLVDSTAAEAEEVGEAVAVDRKRKRKSQDEAEDTAVSAHVAVSCRVTRRSSPSGAVVLLPPPVEKKRGRNKATDGKNELDAGAQDLAAAVSAAIVESKRSGRKGDDYEPAAQKSTKVQASGRITRSRLAAAAVMSPVVSENKRRKTEDVQPDVELPTVLEVPRNDAPLTRALRNRVINNSVVEETHVGKRLENKRQRGRPATRRHQQLASLVEEEDQEHVAAPSKYPSLRRSGRNNSESSNANSDTNKLSSAPVEAKDLNIPCPLTRHNAKGEDVEKQPAVKGHVRRSTRKSVVSAMLEKEDKDLTAEKSTEANVRRSKRKSVVSDKDISGVGEKIQDAKDEDLAKQPAVEPVRRSTRKSVVTAVLEKEKKDLVAEKNPQAHVRRSMRKSVVPVNDNKVIGEEIHNAEGDDVEKQLVVKQPARRSSRKFAPPDMLENKSGFQVAETNVEARVRRSVQKSVLPNMLNEDFQSGKVGGEEKQLKVEEPVRRTRRSVATVVLEKENEGLHEEKKSEIPMRRSTRKSVALNVVEKGNMDHTEVVGREQPGAGARNLEARGQLIDRAVATPENILQVEVAVQNKRPAKRRRTTAPEAVMPVEEAKSDGMVTVEATQDGDKVTHKYSKESSRRIQEICQVNATGEELSADPLLLTHPEEICIVQRVHKLIPGSESGDVDNGCQNPETYHSSVMESSDKCKQAQGHFDIQISDSHLSETRVRELDKKSSTAELVSEKTLMDEGEVNLVAKSKQDVNAGLEALNKSIGISQEIRSTMAAVILESEVPIDEGDSVNAETVKQPDEEVAPSISSCCDDTTVMILEPQFAWQNDSQDVSTEDVLLSDFTVGDREEQSPVPGQGRAGGEANTSESSEKNLADAMSTGLHTKDAVPIDFTIEEHEEERYPVNPIADEKRVSGEENASESAGKTVPGIMSTGLHTKGLHDCDVPTKETGEASELALPISDSKQKVHSDAIAEQSIRDADLGNCLSKGSKGNPFSTNLHSQGVADDTILPVLSAAKGCSSDGRHSSFDLKFLFTEECKESYSRNAENAAVEVDSGSKPIASQTPSFCVGSDCGLEDEGVEPIVYDADKKVDVGQGAAQEEVVAVEISNDEHVAAKLDRETMFNDDCSLAEKNIRLVAYNPDGEQAMVQVQQGDVHEGTLEKPSLCPATQQCEHECGVPKEAVPHSVKNRGSSSSAEQLPFGLQSLFLQENMEESVECSALASATAHIENGGGELKDCHVTCALEKPPVSEPVSHHDTHVGSCLISNNDDCMHTTQQDDGIEGLPNTSHDEQVPSSLSVLLVDANHIKEMGNPTCRMITCEDVACTPTGDGNREVIHSEDLDASNENSDVNGPADNAYDISDAALSSSLHAPDDNDVRLGSTQAQLESTDFLDETIGCSYTEVLNQGFKDQCYEDREEQVASRPCTASAKYIESGTVLLLAEERPDLQDRPLNSKLEGAKVVESGSIGSPTFEEKLFSRVGGTTRNSSFDLATPDYKQEGALSEEAARTMKNYAGTRSSNPRELLMELQSLFSKENIEEFDQQDGLALPSAERRGDESTSVEPRVQLESTGLLDEPRCSSTEVRHQGHKDRCNEDREEQVASGHCTDDIIEAATGKCIGSGVMLLPAEERSNLKDGQLNSKLAATKVMESGLSDEDVSNTSDNGSLASVVSKSYPSGSGLPKDSSTDHHLRYELLGGFSVETSLERSAMFAEKIVSNVGGTIGNPSISLAIPDYKHEGVLSEEALHTMQALFSKENVEEFNQDDGLAFPSAESRGDECTICHVEKLVDTLASSEPGTYQGPCQDLSRDEEKESSMPVSLQDNEQEGVHQHHKEEYHEHNEDQVTSGIHAMSTDAPIKVLESEIAPVQAIATSALPDEQLNPGLEGEKVEKHSFSCEKDTSNVLGTGSVMNKISLLSEKSHTTYCQEQENPNNLSVFKSAEESSVCPYGSDFRSGICQSSGQKNIDEINPKLLSCDTGVLHEDGKEECNELNEDKVTPEVPENDMSESAPVEGTESAIMVLPVAEMSESPDEQLNPKLVSDEGQEHSSCYDKDKVEIICAGSVKVSHLPQDCHIDSCQKQDVPDELPVPKCPEESANCQDLSVLESGLHQTSGQKCINECSMQLTSNIEALNQDHEECNENNEDQITPGIPASGMSEAAQIDISDMELSLTPAAGTSTLLDEQLNSKLEGNEVEEHSCSYDKVTSSLFDTELVEDSKDTYMHPSSEHNHPNDPTAPKSPEESKSFLE